jgi:hypothetical protein
MQCSLGVLRVLICASLLLLSGCVGLSTGKPDGPWHDAYEPIDDPESHAFIADALEKAIDQFGAPAIPVNKVLLRRSRKTAAARKYRIGEDFSLTECADATNGVFVIYIAVDPGHENYFPLLGHECAHLLNSNIFDWYMEGFATAFSAQLCEDSGRKWGSWKRHFERTRREPYGLSYRMMRELLEELPEEYPFIIRHTLVADDETGRDQVDIDAWIATLSPADQGIAVEIIDTYAEGLLRKESEQYYFRPPSAGW